MNITEKNKYQLEILVSTMHRHSLDFVYNMFQNNDISNYRILIINQTTEDVLLESNKVHIRVINSFEKGISKSRNLAIANAIGDICLLADDDVVYVKDFERSILAGFEFFEDAAMINFKALDFQGNDYRNYPNKSCEHTIKSIKGMLSIEIAINRMVINKKNILFDERFGLGSNFPTGEEYLFSRDVICKNLRICFFNEHIVKHSIANSGKLLSSDLIIYARAALNYNIYNKLAYIWIFRYLSFLLTNNYIKVNEFFFKTKVALKGIKDFKNTQ